MPNKISKEIRATIIEILPRLRRFGYTLTGSKEDGDDLTQATLEKVLQKFDQWEPGTRLDSWMFRIAQNLWIDQMRRNKSRGQHVELENAADITGVDGESIAESQLMLEKAQKAINSLPEEQRVVVALVSVDGLSYREAADVLDVPVGTIMSRLARARKSLAKQLLQTTQYAK